MPETRGRSLEDIQNGFHQPKMWNIGRSLRQRLAGTARTHQTRQTPANGSGVMALETYDSHGISLVTSAEPLPNSLRVAIT